VKSQRRKVQPIRNLTLFEMEKLGEAEKLASSTAVERPTVEVDSTFYGCPSARTVNNWAARTPEDFIFSVKVPQIITHERALYRRA
jgi:uncharacterized protein YecE (DUF72 family)